jgi:Family of unknown function (DUF6252)
VKKLNLDIENDHMKSLLTQIALALALFSFLSCSKELSKETGNGTTQQVNGDFYATIGNVQWNADSVQQIQVSNGGVSITGISKTGGQISMILPEFKPGTYTLNAQSTSYALYVNLLDAVPAVYISNQGTASGSVTVSSIDIVNKVMSGSFQFTLVNPADNSTKTITKGVFSYIPYTGDTSVVVVTPPGTADTLKATIDGSNIFSAAQVITSIQSGELIIAGLSSDQSQTLDLAMPANIIPGSYTFDITGGLYFAAYMPSLTVSLISSSGGTLTIISNDTVNKRIKGTFSFKGTAASGPQTASLTLGYFAVNYQ